jgi:hypothetical protein
VPPATSTVTVRKRGPAVKGRRFAAGKADPARRMHPGRGLHAGRPTAVACSRLFFHSMTVRLLQFFRRLDGTQATVRWRAGRSRRVDQSACGGSVPGPPLARGRIAGCGQTACRTSWMTCRAWNARENRRFSCLEKVSEDFFHGQRRRRRMGWDSNPRATCAAAGFQDRCIQPLCHPSSNLTRGHIPGSKTPWIVSVGPAGRSPGVTDRYRSGLDFCSFSIICQYLWR